MAATHPARPAPVSARERLLAAAIKLVRTRGFTATSVDELCREAGVTKGAFFHHFANKDALGVAAAEYWGETTSAMFAGAPYHALADPLDRVLAYLDFRLAIGEGPLEEITCYAGTTVQEVFASSDAIRSACGQAITDHAATLTTYFTEASTLYPPKTPVDPESLALLTQTVLQGGFVTAKATASNRPLLEAIDHLKTYLQLLFPRESQS